VIQPAPVYWLPWSVFIISGLPYRAIASSNASTQKLASNVLESRQVKTLRVAQSIPVAGIGVTLTLMYLEIQDACSTLGDISDFTFEMGYEKHGGSAEFCSLKQSDLKRLINKNKYNLKDCLSQVSEDDYGAIQTCINEN
jgi:hypothetical protein